MKLLIDGHVHVYDCYDLDTFFAAALSNLERYTVKLNPDGSDMPKILLLTEGKENDFFSKFKNNDVRLKNPDREFKITKEECSIVLMEKEKPLCYILRGRQIVTKENLEVLALASNQNIPDGQPIDQVIKKIIEQKEIAVLAWGVGKWFFKRGKVIKKMIEDFRSPYLFVGDNSARPVFWLQPKPFIIAKRANLSVISGSDPLPFAEEAGKVGSFGFAVEGDFDPAEPAKSFREALLSNPDSIRFFGKRDSALSFFKRQAKMFLKKYL